MLSNIKVYVRCRARNEREVAENAGVVVSVPSREQIAVCSGAHQRTYAFDRVFGAESDQESIFETVAEPMLAQILAGYNCTVFAYGQTGTGKTHTMVGNLGVDHNRLPTDAGIIPRSVHKLFEHLKSVPDYSVKVSFIELYNENIRDLLGDESRPLKIFDDAGKKGVLVQGIHEVYIRTAAEGLRLAVQGSERRKVASTRCNDLSSRSHTVFSITVHMRTQDSQKMGGEEFVKVGKLNLVDLGGSENISRSGATNQRAKEAGMINQSLLTLGRVINALVANSPHIPYRESKLTRLLQDSLGGRTCTSIIATLSPAKTSLEETLSTLEYAHTAKSIRNKPQVNEVVNKKTLISEYMDEIERLTRDLNAARTQNGVYLDEASYEQLCRESESRRIRVEELEARVGGQQDRFERARERIDALEKQLEQEQAANRELEAQKQRVEDRLAQAVAETKQLQNMLRAYTKTSVDAAALEDELLALQNHRGRLVHLLDANQHRWEHTQGHVTAFAQQLDGLLADAAAATSGELGALWDAIRGDLAAVATEMSRLNSSSVALLRARCVESRDDFELRLGVLDGGVHERLGAVARDVTAAFQLFLERLGADRELVTSLKEELRKRDDQIMSMQAELKKYLENALAQRRLVLDQENEELLRLVRQAVEQQAGRHKAELDSVEEHVTGVFEAMEQMRQNRPDVLAEVDTKLADDETCIAAQCDTLRQRLDGWHVTEWEKTLARFRDEFIAWDDERLEQVDDVSRKLCENLGRLEACVGELETRFSSTVDLRVRGLHELQTQCNGALRDLNAELEDGLVGCEVLDGQSKMQETKIVEAITRCSQLSSAVAAVHDDLAARLERLEKAFGGEKAPLKRSWNDDKENVLPARKERVLGVKDGNARSVS
ncbi:hypothetical protein KL918_004035 [Ogataea parapolymorpha]|uniref:Kinesin-like protein KIP1 n=1 Tax=Ogataea parapolymorpha (strain ATCC 26012 / BCRC 20466 / JCM 22074 / NRRL Y-7560 / DL-1) TaxID=871575 RepID=W1QCA4_OGAPD|nr:hypothetical protein HPODL_05235 [Ogataea parapolymorpha DL-1]ESW98220.1 hypothetical protein HPODL_05235 [Ogataea parapolymorpha DL-1]KAG7866046.1 hypothetical protein KL918_004035 [Ogataea parapolymorpha]KAG7874800.1 hypothetical protein KL916_001044 [Ogataea parapolymorpha]